MECKGRDTGKSQAIKVSISQLPGICQNVDVFQLNAEQQNVKSNRKNKMRIYLCLGYFCESSFMSVLLMPLDKCYLLVHLIVYLCMAFPKLLNLGRQIFSSSSFLFSFPFFLYPLTPFSTKENTLKQYTFQDYRDLNKSFIAFLVAAAFFF